jgi:hypothetical protein
MMIIKCYVERAADQLLSSLLELEAMLEVNEVVVVVLADSSAEALCVSSEEDWPGRVPSVHTQSLFNLRRPATGVSGQVSLSDSEDESRLSPVRGERILSLLRFILCGNRRFAGEVGDANDEGDSVDTEIVLILRYEPSDRWNECEEDVHSPEDSDEVNELGSDMLSSDDIESIESEIVEPDSCDSISEWAKVNLEVVISSSRGVRNDTLFSAGNLGLATILRDSKRGIGLLARIELSTCELE